MMKVNLFLLLILVCASCSSSAQYEVEEEQYNCVKASFQKNKQINLDDYIQEIENDLIAGEFLKDHSSQSFLQCLHSLTETNAVLPSKMEAQFLLSQMMGYECKMTAKDTERLKASRYAELTKGMAKVYNDIAKTGDIDFEKVKRGIVDNFKESDFDHPFYRLQAFTVLGSFASFKKADRGILGKLSPYERSGNDAETTYVKIHIGKNQTLSFNGKSIKLTALSEKLQQVFVQNRNKNKTTIEIAGKGSFKTGYVHVSLGNEREAEYDFYLKVHNKILAKYDAIWNELAIEVYKIPFDQLNKEQQKTIKGLQLMIISESEPSNH